LQEAADGLIRIVTMSPEYSGSARFIARAAASGVVVAIGHTSANSQQIQAAVEAGARLSTHLGNGAHAHLPRHHNYIWDQLAEDRLAASLIVDGHHLPAAVVRVFVRAKGASRCLLVSDITGMAGMPPGRYDMSCRGGADVEVLQTGRVVIAGQYEQLAGAALPITYGVANVMRFAQVDLQTAVNMASLLPAELIGHEPGALEVGARANLVQFDLPQEPAAPLHIRATMNCGELVWDGGMWDGEI
jgi:N-acetylglucosamine-6-phosphate deacetylase